MFWEAFIKRGQSFATAMTDPTHWSLCRGPRWVHCSPSPILRVHYHSSHSLTNPGDPQHLLNSAWGIAADTPVWDKWPFVAAIKPKSKSVLLNKCFFHPTTLWLLMSNRISSHLKKEFQVMSGTSHCLSSRGRTTASTPFSFRSGGKTK